MKWQIAVVACVVVSTSAFGQSTTKRNAARTGDLGTTAPSVRTDEPVKAANGTTDAPRTCEVRFPSVAPTPSILFYRDSSFGFDAYEQALVGLQWPYTFTTSPTSFASLLGQQNWDLVISANQGSTNLGTFQPALVSFISTHAQSRVFITDWSVDSANTYFPALGFGWQLPKNYTTMVGEPGGPYASLGFWSMKHVWNVCSTYCVSGGSKVLARSGSGEPAIVASANGNVIVNGFLGNAFVNDQTGKQIVASQLTQPPVTVKLEVFKAPTACVQPDAEVTMDIKLSHLRTGVVSGYFGLRWDPVMLQLMSITPGDAPFTTIPIVNSAAGVATILASMPPGSAPSALDCTVAHAKFKAIRTSCDGNGTSVRIEAPALGIAFTDGNGSKVVPEEFKGSDVFVVDNTPPVFSGVQSVVTAITCAGKPCGADAVGLIAPTASDACAPVGSVPVNASRSDGKALSQAWPCGSTRVTWTAADLCGNAAVAYTDVTIRSEQAAMVAIHAVGAPSYAASWGRCLHFAFHGRDGSTPVAAEVDEGVMFNGHGDAMADLEVPGVLGEVPPIPYRLSVTALYQYGTPADLRAGPSGSPETGYARFANDGTSTFAGTISMSGHAGQGGDYATQYASTWASGNMGSLSLMYETSNSGGWNKVAGGFDDGILLRVQGTISRNGISAPISLAVNDKDIHSGSFRTNPFGVYLDNYILQGGDSLGRDTGDGYETSQASGTFVWEGSAPVSGGDSGYRCVLVEDRLHSLKARAAVSIDGCSWKASVQLVLGNITGPGGVRDDVIDVLDWGAYIVRYGIPVGGNDCGARGIQADLDGDGFVAASDGNIILANFGRVSDAPCDGGSLVSPEPIFSITVDDLVRMGLSELVQADLNGDGVLDRADMGVMPAVAAE